MDLYTIISDLNKRFAQPLPEFYKRRIIFWHDEEQEFADQMDTVQLDHAKILILTGKNNFAAKKLLTVEDTLSNYLIYSPFLYAPEEDNWLLNIELYSEEFRADLASILLNDVNLPVTPDFRKLVKTYKKFFRAQSRIAKFSKMTKRIRRNADFHLAIMASICGLDNFDPKDIIREVLEAGTDTEANTVFQDLLKFEAGPAFVELVNGLSGYHEEEFSLQNLLYHILLTATGHNLSKEYLAGLDHLVCPERQTWCYEFVSEWINSDTKQELLLILKDVENTLMLRERFKQIPLENLLDIDVFPCIDECILAKHMGDIKNHLIEAEKLINVVERRRTLAWYDEVKYYYEGLLEVANMQIFLQEHGHGFHTVEAHQIWQTYIQDYYRMDTYYRKYHLTFAKSLMNPNEYLDDLFKHVTDRVEGLYTYSFLEKLGQSWANACADELAENGRILDISQQEDFYQHKIKPEGNRVFVIISDALRYEVAVSLAEQLENETQSKVSLDSCEGIFPTITSFGMAALLPHNNLAVQERGRGSLQVLADGMSTDSGNRETILKKFNLNSVVLKYTDITLMKRTERSELVKGKEVVYIYHDRIDAASHNSDNSVFQACDDAISEIKNLVRIIVNEFSGTRVYITSDHGFLYTYSPLTEDSKLDKTTESDMDVEVGRRYLITRKGATPDYLLPIKFIDPNYEAFAPKENVRIKKRGGGLNYVHGGISLQEMVVPIIEYQYIRNDSKAYLQNKAKYDTKPVEIELLTSSRKITNKIFTLTLYQKDAVASNRSVAEYELYFENENGKAISDTVHIIADKTDSDIKDRKFHCRFVLKAGKLDNKEKYYLVIRDKSGLQLPKKEVFQIDIPFAFGDFDFDLG